MHAVSPGLQQRAAFGLIEVRADRGAQALWAAVTAEAQPLHPCRESSVGQRPIGIESMGEHVDAALGNERPQRLHQLHALTGVRHTLLARPAFSRLAKLI